jgi:transposase InsO family protein
MTLNMNDTQIITLNDVKEFLLQNDKIQFNYQNKAQAYSWVEDTLVKFSYIKLAKADKGVLRTYVALMTGYSRAQVTRLITQYLRCGSVQVTEYQRHSFAHKYQDCDIKLLAFTDELHEFPNGNAVKTTLKRLAASDEQYKDIAEVSVSHIYNLRKKPAYQRITKWFAKTKSKHGRVGIGQRQKPQPQGRPGFIRIDSVHQGDRLKTKGVYHINSIDEVTQFEFIGAVQAPTEEHMLPLLEQLINAYPFKILGFHADNGSEYLNAKVAAMLNRLLIKLTKSRPRHSNDNALVESKNGTVIRKWFGYSFIDSSNASRLNAFYFGSFNRYLNFHRPCAFATNIVDAKGKIKKIYRLKDYKTPYEKLKSLPQKNRNLKKGESFQKLDSFANAYTDNQMAKIVQTQRRDLFEKIARTS